MIGHSFPEYVFINISILCLRLVAPLSIVYLTASIYLKQWVHSRWLGYYAIIEAAFYLLVYLPRSYLLQKAAQHPPLLSREERQALFKKCFARTRDTDLATGWFFSAAPHDIKRDNVAEWLLWALFSTERNAAADEWKEELEYYILMMERLMGRKLDEGWNESVRCMKVTMDPVKCSHRPLIWYAIVSIVDTYTTITLMRHGFIHYLQRDWWAHFPPNLLAKYSRTSPHPHISYWYRPHRSKTKQPVLFLHGIGIGLWTYVPFLFDLIARDPDVGIIAVESFAISMRISPRPVSREIVLEAVTTILDKHNLPEVVVVGHSFGTNLAAYMLKHPHLSKRVAASILVDPIPFLLHLPPVAYNFLYREPKTANEWQLWYFASQDPDIARTLTRHFFWAESILWKEDLKDKRVGVVLSGRDQIVDSLEVWRYLTDQGEADPTFHWQKDGMEVFYYPDLDHSKVFDTARLRKPLVDMVQKVLPINAHANGAMVNGNGAVGPLGDAKERKNAYAREKRARDSRSSSFAT
ncbi:alpha/beta-hydrolase [Panus rudis PR-1116 ss-1]|nr:alpha/beta-hydrolase [Panus rudis PR-1116 ss-1]